MSIESKNLAIKNLILWDENARFPDKYFNEDEIELVKFFLSKPDFKIKVLIEAIVKDFDLPQLEKLVVWNDGEQNIVLEGNRRLTAFKLLCNPLLTTDGKLQSFIEGEKTKINISDDFCLECLVVENKEDAFRYIDRKHYNGNFEVNWKDVERSHYSKRRGSENALELLKIGLTKIVKELDLPDDMKEQVLGSGYVTTFFRIITTTPAKKEYGYSLNDKGDLVVKDKDFKDKLKVIIYSVLNKKDVNGNPIDSRTLNKTDKIEEFIKSVNADDSKRVNEEINKNTEENLFGDKVINIGKAKIENNPSPNSSTASVKSKQIPSGLFHASDVPFKIKSSSLRILYEELRLISVKDFPNATHDLLRSFLECSLIFFFKEIGEFDSIRKTNHHNPKLGEMLNHIINKQCGKITDVNLIESLKQIKGDFDQPYSLERMNMINHNENCASTEKDVRKTWAQLESLFKIILMP